MTKNKNSDREKVGDLLAEETRCFHIRAGGTFARSCHTRSEALMILNKINFVPPQLPGVSDQEYESRASRSPVDR